MTEEQVRGAGSAVPLPLSDLLHSVSCKMSLKVGVIQRFLPVKAKLCLRHRLTLGYFLGNAAVPHTRLLRVILEFWGNLLEMSSVLPASKSWNKTHSGIQIISHCQQLCLTHKEWASKAEFGVWKCPQTLGAITWVWLYFLHQETCCEIKLKTTLLPQKASDKGMLRTNPQCCSYGCLQSCWGWLKSDTWYKITANLKKFCCCERQSSCFVRWKPVRHNFFAITSWNCSWVVAANLSCPMHFLGRIYFRAMCAFAPLLKRLWNWMVLL